MGKTISELNICKEKIENIYKLVNTNLNIEKIILTSRMGYIYDMVAINHIIITLKIFSQIKILIIKNKLSLR